MSNRARLAVIPLLFSAALAFAADQPPDSAPINLTVWVPAGAELELQGAKMPVTGGVCRAVSPPMRAGCEYIYRLKATWTEGSRPCSAEREIRVRAGEPIVVDLRPDDLTAEERQVLEWTNAERARLGLPPLRCNRSLNLAARRHAENMARRNLLSHVLDGLSVTDRISAVGYRWFAAGENCAQGQPTPRDAVRSWMQSPGHRQNILSANYLEIGIGIAVSRGGEKFFTQVFARP